MVDLILYGTILGGVFFLVLGSIMIIFTDHEYRGWFGAMCFQGGGAIALLGWYAKGTAWALYGTGVAIAGILAIVVFLLISRWIY